MEIFKNTKVSVILYYSKNLPYGLDGFERILKTIKEQTIPPEEIIVIDLDERDGTNLNNEDLRIIRGFNLEAEALSEAIEGSSGDYIIYIDNKKYEVLLKRSFIETALMANIRNDNLGMLYTDYEMDTGKS
ncbi:MAG: glycosyltransferase family 2 protein, partial [Candidatus Marinimicrobia bacterium]|nr:glycosyltransferase family 2 protein [Candidatus Neomarinimicrobiota bacterium]